MFGDDLCDDVQFIHSSFGIKFSEKEIEMIEVRSHRDTLGNDDENRRGSKGVLKKRK